MSASTRVEREVGPRLLNSSMLMRQEAPFFRNDGLQLNQTHKVEQLRNQVRDLRNLQIANMLTHDPNAIRDLVCPDIRVLADGTEIVRHHVVVLVQPEPHIPQGVMTRETHRRQCQDLLQHFGVVGEAVPVSALRTPSLLVTAKLPIEARVLLGTIGGQLDTKLGHIEDVVAAVGALDITSLRRHRDKTRP